MANEMSTADALQSLKPGAEWVLRGDVLEWLDGSQTEPTALQLSNEVTRLQGVHDGLAYSAAFSADGASVISITKSACEGSPTLICLLRNLAEQIGV